MFWKIVKEPQSRADTGITCEFTGAEERVVEHGGTRKCDHLRRSLLANRQFLSMFLRVSSADELYSTSLSARQRARRSVAHFSKTHESSVRLLRDNIYTAIH